MPPPASPRSKINTTTPQEKRKKRYYDTKKPLAATPTHKPFHRSNSRKDNLNSTERESGSASRNVTMRKSPENIPGLIIHIRR